MDSIDQQVMFSEKSWGYYRVLDVSDRSMTVKVTLNPGHGMNYHSYERRDEVLTVISGSGSNRRDNSRLFFNYLLSIEFVIPFLNK